MHHSLNIKLMKAILFSLSFLFSALAGFSQMHHLTVYEGYGDGDFNVGDTVHIWARGMEDTEVFATWVGEVAFLNEKEEWHTTLVMPDQDVTVSAEFGSVGGYTTEYIQGVELLKKVYYAFPASPVGLVFLFHGTNGNADGWVSKPESFQMFRDLLAQQYAVVVTEAEEVTLGYDLNGDSVLRWMSNVLTIDDNVDVRNIQALIDTFENRGLISPSIKKYAVGMSNGGSFCSTVSFLLSFDAAVPYCSKGNPLILTYTEVPTYWCMQEFDDNENVGPEAYGEVLDWSAELTNRDVCSGVFLNRRSPVYPQIFARDPSITEAQSLLIFNELNNSGFLDYEGGYYYMNIFARDILSLVAADPSSYPVLSALASNFDLLTSVGSEMDVTHAGHKFYSAHNKRTIAFLQNPCSFVTATAEVQALNLPSLSVYPNPVAGELNILLEQVPNGSELSIYNASGIPVASFPATGEWMRWDVSRWPKGMYFLRVGKDVVEFLVE